MKPPKERRGRGRGRNGGRGGRGGRGDKVHQQEQKDQSYEYGYDDDEMWSEYLKWKAELAADDWETPVPEEKKSKKREAESTEKSKREPVEKRPNENDTVATEPKKAKRSKAHGVQAPPPIELDEDLIGDMLDFVNDSFKYEDMEMKDFRAHARSQLPQFQRSQLIIYWTRPACGVRQRVEGRWQDAAYFSFRSSKISLYRSLMLIVCVSVSMAARQLLIENRFIFDFHSSENGVS